MTDHRMTDEEAAFNAQQAVEVATKDEVVIEPINFVDSARQCDICGFAHEKKQFLGQGWRRGAGVLRGGKAGRREKDDPEALAWGPCSRQASPKHRRKPAGLSHNTTRQHIKLRLPAPASEGS